MSEQLFEVIGFNELHKKLSDWRNGKWKPRKLYCGHPKIDALFAPMLGSCLDITGYPGHGKTLFAEELAVTWLLQNSDIKHWAYIPDAGSDLHVAASYVNRLSGMSVDPNSKNLISEKELNYHLANFCNQFQMVRIKKGHTTFDPLQFYEAGRDSGAQVVWLDSYNHLRKRETSTSYLSECLQKRNEIAEFNELLFVQIVHPKNATSEHYSQVDVMHDGQSYKARVLNVPNQFSIMGGSEWNNYGKTIISVYKEIFYVGKRILFSKPDFDVEVCKAKNAIEGQKGYITLYHDWERKAFYTNSMGTKQYTLGRYGNPVVTPDEIKPNTNFLTKEDFEDEPF